MPSRALPTTNKGRDRLMTIAKRKNDSVPIPERGITVATQTRLNTKQPLYRGLMQGVADKFRIQTLLTASLVLALAEAKTWLSDFASGLIRWMKRAGTLGWLNGYSIPSTHPVIPEMGTQESIETVGTNFHNGESARVLAGGAAMSNPTMLETDGKVAAVVTIKTSQSTAKDGLDTAQGLLDDENIDTDHIIKKIADELGTFYNEGTPESVRRRLREYGIPYVSNVLKTFTVYTYNLADNSPVKEANIDFIESGKSGLSGIDGIKIFESRVMDIATFDVTHPEYHDGESVVTVSETVTEYRVNIGLVHI